MAKLFSTFEVKDMELKNRIVMAPMCMYSAGNDGLATPWHTIHYATRAQGGVGLIIQEATAVESRGRITANDLGIWSDDHIKPLKEIVDTVHSLGAKMGIQLQHAGRKCTVANERILAPSAIAFSHDYRIPHEMTTEEIKEVVQAFRDAAKRVLEVGYDVIELHGAHGYLINEFLSPLANKRTDEYGGSKENRVRLLKEVVMAVREVWPMEKPLIVRVSAYEYHEEGNDAADVAQMLSLVKQFGIDLINVSSGGVVLAPVPLYQGYQVNFAEVVRKQVALPVMAGGLITNAFMAEEILSNNRADLIFLGRVLLRDPYWALSADAHLHQEVTWPKQYERGKPRQIGYVREFK